MHAIRTAIVASVIAGSLLASVASASAYDQQEAYNGKIVSVTCPNLCDIKFFDHATWYWTYYKTISIPASSKVYYCWNTYGVHHATAIGATGTAAKLKGANASVLYGSNDTADYLRCND